MNFVLPDEAVDSTSQAGAPQDQAGEVVVIEPITLQEPVPAAAAAPPVALRIFVGDKEGAASVRGDAGAPLIVVQAGAETDPESVGIGTAVAAVLASDFTPESATSPGQPKLPDFAAGRVVQSDADPYTVRPTRSLDSGDSAELREAMRAYAALRRRK